MVSCVRAILQPEKGFVQLFKEICLDAPDMNNVLEQAYQVGGPSAWEKRCEKGGPVPISRPMTSGEIRILFILLGLCSQQPISLVLCPQS